MNSDDGVWLVVVGVAVSVSWLPHLVFSARRWRHERSHRAFRGLFVAAMMQMALMGGTTSSILRTWPFIDWLAFPSTIFRVVSLALVLSGGLVLWAAWIHERRRSRA